MLKQGQAVKITWPGLRFDEGVIVGRSDMAPGYWIVSVGESALHLHEKYLYGAT